MYPRSGIAATTAVGSKACTVRGRTNKVATILGMGSRWFGADIAR